MYDAAVARAEADWLVGLNATRALTCRYNAQLSCGRVQTPTLSMIAAREAEIRSFIPQPFYGLKVKCKGTTFTWKDEKSGSYRTFSKEKIEKLAVDLTNDRLTIRKVEAKKKKSMAPLLYDLTELQREANRKFGFSAKETLNIMQRLYENHKVLTYPRTDSRYLTSDIVGTIRERLHAVCVGSYRVYVQPLLKQKIKASPAFVNDSKVGDHHAIIPTEQMPVFSHMTNEEKKIYDLVVRRFLAVLYPPYEYEETTLMGESCGAHFYAKGTRTLSAGWHGLYEESQKEEEREGELEQQELAPFQEQETYRIEAVQRTEGKTKPPARFNEATLLSAMENPVRYMQSKDKTMAKTLNETGGLGTVATRADIIEKLFSSFLIEKKKDEIYTTSKARQLLELVPGDLKKPELTAKWEMKLSQIADGTLKSRAFMKDIRSYTVELVDEIKKGEGTFRHDNMTSKICPQCGKHLLAVNGKNSKMLVCQDRACGYRQTISRTTNARCPQCHKRMELVGSKEKSMFVCVCGHKERMEKFQERRKKEGAGVSKREVQNYLKKQKKEADEPINQAFAAALKNIKLK